MLHSRFYISTLIAGLATLFLRALPFLFFSNRPVPKVITYLGKYLPLAIMTTLVIFCLRGISFSTLSGYLPAFIGVLITAILHIWKKNALISITIGTICYMVLLRSFI